MSANDEAIGVVLDCLDEVGMVGTVRRGNVICSESCCKACAIYSVGVAAHAARQLEFGELCASGLFHQSSFGSFTDDHCGEVIV